MTRPVSQMTEAERLAHNARRRAYNARYYAANAEKFRADARAYRAQNREEVRKKERAYYQTNPAKLLLKCARQRARRFDLPFDLTVEDIRAAIPADGCCPVTGERFEQGEGKVGPRSMTLDRVNPSLGYVRGNIAVISHLANTIKQNCTDPALFRRLADYLERI